MADFSTAPSQTLARLSFWVPADRLAEFEAAYRAKLEPLLKPHGLVESAQRGRQTVEGVFSRLFEMEGPAEVVAKKDALEADPAWQGALLELGTAFGSEDGVLRWHFGTYTAPAGRGRVVEAIGKNVPAGPGKGHWHTYDISDGLPGVTVHSILQDREGYMWFCTWAQGVSRYDGHKFTSITTQDGLVSNRVRCFIQDRDGYFWFGTGSGVSRYDGHRFTTFTTQDGLVDNWVRLIFQDREGSLWFGTGGGVSRYDGHRFTNLTTQDGLAGNWMGSMLQDQEGHFWFGTGNGVSRYDGRHFTTFNTRDGLAASSVWVVFQDREGSLWFGTAGGGVSRYDGHRFATLTTQDGLAHNEVSSIMQDREGYLWFGTWEGGVSRYDGHRFTTFTTQDGLADDQVSSIYQDREGYLWFSTWGGVSRYDGHNVTFTAQDGLAGNRVRSILQDREENLWFGTDDGGVSCYDGHRFTNFTAQDGLAGNQVWSILQDREGSLWFGTEGGGVSRYGGHRFTTFTIHDGLASNYVYAILQDQEGHLWFGTGNGVSRYDGLRFTTFTSQDGLASNAIASLMQDREGYLWFGTWEGGVSCYDGHRFTTFTAQDGLSHNWVRSIFQDREGDLWIGTEGGGVSRYDGHRFSTFTIQDGLLPNVASIMQDRQGHLWFSTYGGGGYRYDGLTLQTVLRQDGLASNLVTQIIQDQAGRLWFGTNRGVTRFSPSSLVPPPVFIDAVVANQRYEEVSEVEVPDSTKVASFEFHSISFKTQPEAMVYRYRLKGYEEEWKITHSRQVGYQNLPLGEYAFQVQAVDRDLNYSEPAQALLKVIPDPRDERIDELEERVQERTRELEETHQRLQETQAKLIVELEDELQTAHKLQMGLMPKESPRVPGLDLAGRCVTANHVGGDFFQYFHRDRKLTLCLADVTGHAMEAAIPMVMFSGVLKSQMEIGGVIEELFGRLNRSLHGTLTSHTFICLAMGELDLDNRLFRFSNAGCPYPYHYQAATGEVIELRVDAYPLGVRLDTKYQTIGVQLAPGDQVVLCSDGIIEATNEAGGMFGFERTAETIRRGCHEELSAEALLERLMAEVKGFRGEVPQGDDQTAVVLKVEK